MVSIGIDSTRLRQGLENVRTSLNNASGRLQGIGNNMKKIGGSMATNVSLPLSVAGGFALKMASDFESGMSEVQAISGATAQDFALLREKAKRMGASTKFSATQSAEALKYMALAGWDTSKMVEGLDGVLQLAAASGEDLASTTDIVTDAMTAFKMEAKEAGKFADILAMTSAKSNTNVAMLGEAFKYSAPVAGALGASAEDTAVALGMMANSGIKASMAGTAMRSLLTNLSAAMEGSHVMTQELGAEIITLADGSIDLNSTIKSLRKQFAGLTKAQQASWAEAISSKPAMAGVLAIMTATDESYNSLENSIYNATGKAKDMADIMQGNLKGSLTQMMSALEGLAIQIGDIMLPAFKSLIDDYLKPLIGWFSKLSPTTQKWSVIIAGVLAILGPIIVAVGALMAAIGAIIPVITAVSGPVWAVIAGLVALGAAIGALWAKNEAFRNNIKRAWNKIKLGLEIAFLAIQRVALTVWNQLILFWQENGELIKETFFALWDLIVAYLKANWEIMKTVAISIFDGLKDFWAEWGDEIKFIFKAIWEGIKVALKITLTALKNIFKLWTAVFNGDWEAAWTAVKDYFVEMWEIIKQTVENVIEFILEKVGVVIEKIQQMIDMANKVGGGISSGISSAKSYIGSIAPKFFADGGIVTSPTLGVVGEAGPEAIIPLNQLGNMGGNTSVTIYLDSKVLASKTAPAMVKQLRLQGV